MNVPKGFKQTEVGVLPDDWESVDFSDLISSTQLGGNYQTNGIDNGLPLVKMGNLGRGNIILSKIEFISNSIDIPERDKLKHGDVLFNTRNTLELVGKVAVWKNELPVAYFNSNIMRIYFKDEKIGSNFFMNYILNSTVLIAQLKAIAIGTTSVAAIYSRDLFKIKIPLPPTRAEQTAIAAALSDMDALIDGVEKLLEKKRRIKQGAMQELLKPKEGWNSKTLACLIDCLDSLRVPLNENQRLKMKGNIPYCGANGIVDYINDYLIDDKIVLMAEDGGYFDEYDTRPIAYQVSGKCWINNHAHILKAKEGFNQNFIFYSLVNKNIQFFLSHGTRSKLTKGEMLRIEINIPEDESAQMEISQILSDMDSEIEQLEKQLAKYRQLKTGMMQELLTGKKRLV